MGLNWWPLRIEIPIYPPSNKGNGPLMERGAPYLRAFAPYALVLLALLMVLYLIYDSNIRLSYAYTCGSTRYIFRILRILVIWFGPICTHGGHLR